MGKEIHSNVSRADTRPSVAFFHVSAILGGAERSFLDLIPLGANVISITLPENGALAHRLQGTEWKSKIRILEFERRLKELSRGDGLRNFLSLPLASPAIFRYLRAIFLELGRERPEIIYSHGIKNHFLLSLIGYLRGIPVVWHLQDFWPRHWGARLFFRWAVRRNCYVICNSDSVRKDLDPRDSLKKRVRVVHNAIDPKDYPFLLPSERAQNKIVVGFVGMLVPWKAPHLLIEAMRRLVEKSAGTGMRLELWIVGGVPYKTNAMLSRYAEDLKNNAPSFVRFLGLQQETKNLYRDIHILCHTSKDPEPFGRVILEGMSSGCLVIGSAAGGPIEMISNGSDGFLFSPGSLNALIAAIENAFKLSKSAKDEMATRAREKVEKLFSAEAYRAKVESFLLEVREDWRNR